MCEKESIGHGAHRDKVPRLAMGGLAATPWREYARNPAALTTIRLLAQTIANKTLQRQKETDARRKPKALRQNPSGRNRTSDQLISKNTETQYSTLQSIALPTELHSVISLLSQQTHKKSCTSFDTHSHASYITQHIMSAMSHSSTTSSAHQYS